MVGLLGRIRGKKDPDEGPEEDPKRSRASASARKRRRGSGSAPARGTPAEAPRPPVGPSSRGPSEPEGPSRSGRPNATRTPERSPPAAPVRTKVPDTPPDPGPVRADRCFVCGSSLDGAFCPECQMRWVE